MNPSRLFILRPVATSLLMAADPARLRLDRADGRAEFDHLARRVSGQGTAGSRAEPFEGRRP